MNWIIISLLSYFLLALVSVFDKLILKSVLPDPKNYVFYFGLPLGFLIPLIFLWPWPSLPVMGWALLSGFCFNLGLYWVYKCLKDFDSSSVVPMISGLMPILSALLVFGFFQEMPNKVWPFFLLIFGSVLSGLGKGFKLRKDIVVWSFLSAFFIAVSFVVSKMVFDAWPDFLPALVWIKLGGFAVSVVFFALFASVRKSFLKQEVKQKNIAVFYGNQFLGMVANILQNYAVMLAPMSLVAVINALQGSQYIFLFALAAILSRLAPNQIKEDFSFQVILSKLIGIVLIFAGLWQIM